MRPSLRTLLAVATATALAAPLVPASAAPAAPAPRVERSSPAAVVQALLSDPGPASLAAWQRSVREAVTGGPAVRASATTAAEPALVTMPDEPGALDAVADLDGDRLPEVLDLTDAGTTVRSGRTGAVLGRRAEPLVEVPGSGPVRLLALDVAFEGVPGGFAVTLVLSGLDRRLRPVWEHRASGTVREVSGESGYAAALDRLPLLVDVERTALLATVSGGATSSGLAGTLQVDALDLQTGAVTPLASAAGAGSALPAAHPVRGLGGRRTCVATTAPAGPGSLVALACDGSELWRRPVDLPFPFVEVAGRFPGDAVPDLLVTDPGSGPPEEGGGSRVLSGADGTGLATSTLSGLLAMGVDVTGDGRPDVQRIVFDEGLGIEGLTLEGRRLYRREARLDGSGGASVAVLDLSGDGVPDGLLTVEPEGGRSLTGVVEGRRGGVTLRQDVDGLSFRGLTGRGVDLLVRDLDRGRVRVTALQAVGGRVLRRSTVPGARGTSGAPGRGAVTGVHLDGDGRRDLVVVSRVGTTRLISALRADGRALWQQRERSSAPPPDGAMIG